MLTVTDVARICHAANAELCTLNGDWSQPAWESAPEWMQASARDGVAFHCEHPEATPEDSHKNWMRGKAADGWIYGEEKNPDAKTHPCMVPYGDLPAEQRAKDYLFRGIVHALRPFSSPPNAICVAVGCMDEAVEWKYAGGWRCGKHALDGNGGAK